MQCTKFDVIQCYHFHLNKTVYQPKHAVHVPLSLFHGVALRTMANCEVSTKTLVKYLFTKLWVICYFGRNTEFLLDCWHRFFFFYSCIQILFINAKICYNIRRKRSLSLSHTHYHTVKFFSCIPACLFTYPRKLESKHRVTHDVVPREQRSLRALLISLAVLGLKTLTFWSAIQSLNCWSITEPIRKTFIRVC